MIAIASPFTGFQPNLKLRALSNNRGLTGPGFAILRFVGNYSTPVRENRIIASPAPNGGNDYNFDTIGARRGIEFAFGVLTGAQDDNL